MNIDAVLRELNQQYPGKKVIITDPKNPGEIICETEPTEEHPDWSEGIAVIDFTRLHYHQQLTEIYEVLLGELDITVNGKPQHLHTGEKITIPPLARHRATGRETWIRVSAKPGWTPENHILVMNKWKCHGEIMTAPKFDPKQHVIVNSSRLNLTRAE